VIFEISHSPHAGATGAAVHIQSIFHTVANHPRVAAFAMWGKFADGAFKAIK
jgi:hypothetical protein